ncbi:imidazole glycerol phosphate synthase subunit HisH [Ramlibacter albus]|uniref:Imidazole glycerol phosphate synthase subunit HisH n=1 Tax=Ramlibacter albus TaxID=2079448 RepID=A0A923S4H7_9BURK|nr:imidazole glycerol phosphate synthase subunit HisH [Ramlibacter albus]
MIGIIDYGSGNIHAIADIYKALNVPHRITRDPAELAQSDRYILPGVGAFDTTMRLIEESGFLDTLREQVQGRGKPLLGICVGMQVLAAGSEEGERAGLGWVQGMVKRIDTSRLTRPPLLPHMGWNSLDVREASPLLEGVDTQRGFYFLHSFCFHVDAPGRSLATAQYGEPLHCVVAQGNVYGIQFHPEKSHANGVRVFLNFAKL